MPNTRPAMPLPAQGLLHLRDNPAMSTPFASPEIVRTSLRWDNGFHALGTQFYTPLAPQPLPAPYWVGCSESMARQLGLGADWRGDDLLQVFSGNRPLAGTRPLASVYSGHQFGHWAGQLGDGRAILLGETQGLEIQLKGSGLTPYSRMGDGRAVLRSSIREFLVSEAMHALGIPTTRALCVTGSDATVHREQAETAAVVTRVAPSFIRFGHFEHFAARQQDEALKRLADYVIDRHYPDCARTSDLGGNAYAALLQAVTERTAVLLAHWQAVGFCHGVMNTDNMSILGLTLDYGPFQFLDGYDPQHICNHSDRQGRYAFKRQPEVAHWNLYCLGQALMPLIHDPALALQALERFKPVFETAYAQQMAAKLGLTDALASTPDPLDTTLLQDLLDLLARERVDYPIFWRRLSQAQATGRFEPVREMLLNQAAVDAWLQRYQTRLAPLNPQEVQALMRTSNPKFVLRNHLGELAIRAARDKDFSVLERLQTVLAAPFDEHPGHDDLADFPPDWAGRIEISCSS